MLMCGYQITDYGPLLSCQGTEECGDEFHGTWGAESTGFVWTWTW